MKLIESFSHSKYADGSACEDHFHIGPHYVGVFDGATAKTGTTFQGMTPGRFIAQRLGGFLETAEAGLHSEALVQAMTACIAREIAACLPSLGELQEGPSASIAVYAQHSHTITVVGDVQCLVNGRALTRPKRIDTLLGEVRAIYIRLLMNQAGENRPSQDDPGRQLILPVLRLQHLLQNSESFGGYGYGCINGRPVPGPFIETYVVQPSDEVVLCTDGYPDPATTLQAAEAALQAELESDPLRIFHHPGTKGLQGERFVSFDDRTYVRFIA